MKSKAQPSHGRPSSPLPGVMWVKLADIDTTDQVRKSMDKASLQELADDIAVHGLLQPIILRPTGSRYTVIAGHRRRLACEMAGLKLVPAVVGEADQDQVLEMQLAENLQREDLDPDEIGRVLTKLYEKHASLDTVALIVNKSKPWVAKHIKFAERLGWRARELFDTGVTEDVDLLLALDQLNQVDYLAAEEATKAIRAGNLTREQLRAQLAAAKAHKRAEPHHQATRKPAKPRPRSIAQMCREIEYPGKKKSAEIIATWTDKEREQFYAEASAAWTEGRTVEHKAYLLAIQALRYDRHPFKLARMMGFLIGTEKPTTWPDVQDEFLRQLDLFVHDKDRP